MVKLIKVKPIINKKNNQVNISLSRKKLPSSLKELLKSDPDRIKCLKFKYEGWS